MASVRSLGVHKPSALPLLVSEGILPPEPPASSYKWRVFNWQENGQKTVEEELLSTKHCVVWSKAGIVEQIYSFDVEKEPIVDAVFTNFNAPPQTLGANNVPQSTHRKDDQTSANEQLKFRKPRSGRSDANREIPYAEPEHTCIEGARPANDHSAICRGLVVVLKTQVHVYMIAGTSHIVHIPFEVDAVFRSFRGVLLQRKATETSAAVNSPLLPSAPNNTFSYSQSSDLSTFGPTRPFDGLSTETVNQDSDPLLLPSLEKLLASNLNNSGPEAASFFCLTDPLTQLGSVIARDGAPSKIRPTSQTHTSTGYSTFDANEGLLYISSEDEIKKYNRLAHQPIPLAIALTVNTKKGTTNLWTLTQVSSSNEGEQSVKRSKGHVSRRRSSFASRLSTGATTPIARSYLQSSWESRNEEGSSQRQPGLLDSVFEHTTGPSRSSRRVSSLLARADLSTDQDRVTFTDAAAVSRGTRKSRQGASFGIRAPELEPQLQINSSRSRSTPLLDVRSSLDSVALHGLPVEETTGVLDDFYDPRSIVGSTSQSDTWRLKQELFLDRIYSLDLGNPKHAFGSHHEDGFHCFTLESPGHCLSNLRDGSFLICVLFRRLKELLIFQVNASPRGVHQSSGTNDMLPNAKRYDIKVTGSRRAGVLDACKVSHGSHEWILVLDAKGGALTLQAPWSSLLKINLPNPLNLYKPFDFATQTWPRPNDDGGPRRLVSQGLKEVSSLGFASQLGYLDLVDPQGQRHRVEIKLEPASHFVQHIIDVCQTVLPSSESSSEALLRGWWDVMSWSEARDEGTTEKEWTALIVLVFSMAIAFVDDKMADTTLRQKKRKGGLLRSSSGANTDLESWNEMMRLESDLSLGGPAWMEKQGAWDWTNDKGLNADEASQPSHGPNTSNTISPASSSQIVHYAQLAREFIRSSVGQAAIGRNGYLPIALSKDMEIRRTALPSILVALHLYYEELKLDVTCATQLHALTPVLAQLGTWLGWHDWSCQQTSYYMLESSGMASSLFEDSRITGIQLVPQPFPPPSILRHLEQATRNSQVPAFPLLLDVVGAPASEDGYTRHVINTILMDLTPRTYQLTALLGKQAQRPKQEQVTRMASVGITLSLLETLPESIAVPFRAKISSCEAEASNASDLRTLSLVEREDLALLENDKARSQPSGRQIHTQSEHVSHEVHHICNQATEVENIGPYDGSAEIDRQSVTRMLFSEDQRFAEAASLVHPLHYPVAKCAPEPGWTDSDLLEAQQELAKVVAMRTLSVSLGRSLLFYSARLPMLTEKYPVHGFTLSCTMKPSDSIVTADKGAFTEDKVSWAFFHAGVESGLSISKNATGVDTSWILFNKPKELTNRHAGFLLALGLNGHLKSIAKWVAFKYLTPKHNMTSIGLLLGLSASFIGTMDTLITRLLSVHVTRMLPPGAAELNLSPLTQTCGIFGIGLLYCNTQHRRMSEIMLSEMENMELEDAENPTDPLRDEGYRLAAGFSLGLINLGRGKDLKGLQDMHIPERLLTLAVAIKIVDHVHISHSTTAGAIMAIALMCMKTNDDALARKIDVPDTPHQYDYVRPDQFLLRTVAKHLILWDTVQADHDWLVAQVPSNMRLKSIAKIRILSSEELPLFNILSGLCLSIGLRFAGTGNIAARDLLCTFLDHFMRLCRLPASNYDTKLARITVRNCQDLIALAAACVMAGTGDLVILRRLRSLHGRTDTDTPYGSHLAAHFAIGILFLGGGTHTFGTSTLGVASILVAFYPLFPSSVLDNKSHLQALRHFWVLAAEPRCLVPRDIDTHRPLSCPVRITLIDGSVTKQTAPCLLPDLSTIAQISSADLEFWPITLDFANNPNHLSAFRKHQSIYLRRRGAYDASNSSIFSATMKAISDKQTVHQLRQQPFEWLFELPAFSALDRAERSLLLPGEGAGSVGSAVKSIRGTVVDDRLMLETGCLGSGKSERLWNLRLLLSRAEECEKKGEKLGWLRREVVEGLRARLALWTREGK